MDSILSKQFRVVRLHLKPDNYGQEMNYLLTVFHYELKSKVHEII